MKKKLTACILALMMIVAVALPAAAELLKFNDEGPQVGLLQLKLKSLNYYTGKIDNKFGYLTYLAVRDYQKNNGLKADGVAGEDTLAKLGIGPPSGKPADTPDVLRLAYGSKGSKVKEVQERLAALGYFAGDANGEFYDSTYYAVIAFQKNNYLRADGIVGDATWARLFSKDAISKVASLPSAVLRLKLYDKGADVTKLQQRLAMLGYYTRKVDGVYTYYTYLCVRHFQKINNLTVDGVVGPQTWELLMSDKAKKASDDSSPPAPKVFRLQYGDKGADVLALQNRLADLGYYAGAKDSYFYYTLYLAVRKFQRINGLKVDGVVGPLTWNLLMSDKAKKASDDSSPPAPKVFRLQYKDKNADVLALQNRLADLGYYAGAKDSYFNYTLYLSVRKFQRQNGLKVDGVVGEKTWNLLMSAEAKPYEKK